MRSTGGDDAEAPGSAHLQPVQFILAQRAISIALAIGHGGERNAIPGLDAIAENYGVENADHELTLAKAFIITASFTFAADTALDQRSASFSDQS